MSNVRKSSASVSKKKSVGKKSIKNQNSKMSNVVSNMDGGSVNGEVESKVDLESKADVEESKVDLESKIEPESKEPADPEQTDENLKSPEEAPEVPQPITAGEESALIDDSNPIQNAEESALIDMDQPEDLPQDEGQIQPPTQEVEESLAQNENEQETAIAPVEALTDREGEDAQIAQNEAAEQLTGVVQEVPKGDDDIVKEALTQKEGDVVEDALREMERADQANNRVNDIEFEQNEAEEAQAQQLMAELEMSEAKPNDMTEEKLLMDNNLNEPESPDINFGQFDQDPLEPKDMDGQFVEQINDNVIDPDQEDKDPFDFDNDEEIDIESVRALTLKDGVDYENEQQNIFIPDFEPQSQRNYQPEDYIQQDVLNRVDDQVDSSRKLGAMQDEAKNDLDQQIKDEYLQKFRKEVDFHHKVAYRYEKSYRLSKKHPEKREALNQEILEIISEHSNYIEQDPLALFYCLYFCIYYNNPELVEFLRNLIQKISNRPERMDQMLQYIDVNGIERIRTVGEQINSHVYHMVFYQAVDDDLRVVYSQILRQLKFVMLRDKDALQFLKQRDYDLIRLTFEKQVAKLKIQDFYKQPVTLKSLKYRNYNQAFYEEILIDFTVEQRVAQNYRERFLISAEDIYLVLSMYSKNDYINYFLRLDLSQISHKQFVELFEIAIKNDAFKVALHIYLRFLTNADMDSRIMEIFIHTLKDSLQFHEMKMFFIHEHFDVYSIAQLNLLIDTYMEILNHKEFKQNPMLSQFNTIKYALLIYRISWKVDRKKIYSLTTKCSVMNKYIMDSLTNYLSRQQHISQLYKFMREPIFHMTEKKDSLDIMLEMNMNVLLQNPVIVEVLNLVYEGKYSVDSSATNLSQTFQSFFLMDVADLKSINDRLWRNIRTIGEQGNSLQSSLQFNIWKQCIEQREIDEMRFTVIVSGIVIVLGFWIDMEISKFIANMRDFYSEQFVTQPHIFVNADPAILDDFCPVAKTDVLNISKILGYFSTLILISLIGYITSIVQKFTVIRINDNAELAVNELLIQIAVSLASIAFVILQFQNHKNPLLTDVCDGVVEFSDKERDEIGYVYSLLAGTSFMNFQLIVSIIVLLYAVVMIMMLQRTQNLGELIMMVGQMVSELRKWLLTFGLLLILFILLGRQLNEILKKEKPSFFKVFQDIFDGLNGQQNFDDYTTQGTVFITLFVFLFNVLLLSFLVAMFINRYKFVYRNLDAIRRMNIIKLKNSASYDNKVSAVTITFFPISIVLLPFIPAVIAFKSERLNDFILKLQYTIMMLMYCCLALLITVPVFSLLYFKSVCNSLYIALNNKRENFKGENIVKLILTILFNPILVLVSFLVDLISMPSLLLKDERGFEFKYQQALEILNSGQVHIILTTFVKIFYVNFKQIYGGKGMNLSELMVMHTRIFSIIENLHDLCCRGTKDYRQALANVQDYNMTKILTRKCSVPDRSGDIKLARCDFNILYNIQMDIELYNYFEILMRDYNLSQLTQENLEKDRKKFKKQEEDNEKAAMKMNAGVSFNPMAAQPPGVTFKRDSADFMNNFFVNIVANSFTNIEEILRNNAEDVNAKAIKQSLGELQKIEKVWQNKVLNTVNREFSAYDAVIQQNNNRIYGTGEIVLNQKQKEMQNTGSVRGPDTDMGDLIDM